MLTLKLVAAEEVNQKRYGILKSKHCLLGKGGSGMVWETFWGMLVRRG